MNSKCLLQKNNNIAFEKSEKSYFHKVRLSLKTYV